MKKYLIIILLILSIGVYGEKYNFEYKSIPQKVDCTFDYDIRSQKNDNILFRYNLVTCQATLENDIYKGVLKSDIENKVFEKACDFKFDNDIKSLKVSGLTEKLHQGIDLPKSILSAQFSLPEKEVGVGDLWYIKVKNPLQDKDITLECRLFRVADNIATVYFSVKSPFRPNHMVTERELMREKLHDGSTFYFKIDTLSGHAEITGSGLWIFDLKNGTLLGSDQFYKVTSLMREDDRADIKSVKDFIYVDVTFHYNYEFGY